MLVSIVILEKIIKDKELRFYRRKGKCMKTYVGVGDRVKVKGSYFVEGYHIPQGTEFEITFVDRQGVPYCCRGLTVPITMWLRWDQFDIVK